MSLTLVGAFTVHMYAHEGSVGWTIVDASGKGSPTRDSTE